MRHAEALADDRNVATVAGELLEVEQLLDPDQLLGEKGSAWSFLDRSRPVAVFHTAPLRGGSGEDGKDAAAVMQGYAAALPPGSFTVATQLLDPQTAQLTKHVRRVEQALLDGVGTGRFRTLDEIAALFDGQELRAPGIVLCRDWSEAVPGTAGTIADCLVGGIGHKPASHAADETDNR